MTNQHETLKLLLGILQKPAQTVEPCGLKIFQSVKIGLREIPDHPNKKNNIILRVFSGHCPGDKKASAIDS